MSTRNLIEGDGYRLYRGDCLDVLREMPEGSIDAVVTDPPYPEIDRPYGRLTEAEWFAMMRVIVPECMRVLKPSGSAVFVLQPNSERVGRMRTWLWEFMVWVGKEWGIVQDVWWWNCTALPMTKNDPNLLRASVKVCVWAGPPGAYRNADEVLWSESDANRACRESGRCNNKLQVRPSGATMRRAQAHGACVARGGVTPFNLIPVGSDGNNGKYPHPARTPLALCSWWVRYICPPGGVVLDPFAGSFSTGAACLQSGRRFIGVELDPTYFKIGKRRMAEAAKAAAVTQREAA